MSADTLSTLWLIAGFTGLAVVLATIAYGKALLERAFPRWRPSQVHRVLTIVLLAGALVALGGLFASIRQTGTTLPCPPDMREGDICY